MSIHTHTHTHTHTYYSIFYFFQTSETVCTDSILEEKTAVRNQGLFLLSFHISTFTFAKHICTPKIISMIQYTVYKVHISQEVEGSNLNIEGGNLKFE